MLRFASAALATFSMVLAPAAAAKQPPKQPRCPDANHCPPPGMCSQKQYDALVATKERACNQVRACRRPVRGVDCKEYRANIQRNLDCKNARNAVMMKCFKGGDARHRRERDNVVRDLNNCKKYLSQATSQNFCR
jgi:hypothetical protein